MRTQLAMIGAAMAVTACASTGAETNSSAVYDPFEGFNRNVFAFNNGVDKVILKPAADGYRAITNKPIRKGVSNFLNNLGQPIVFANSVLQGKPEAALDTFVRFLVNTTVGIGGIFDPATAAGVPEHDEDFGQTLGVWGVPPGPYLMTPMGPSNLRDAIGGGIDNAFEPFNYVDQDDTLPFRITTGVVGVVSARERLDGVIAVLSEQPEPYVALRRNYTQQRAASIRDGQEETDPFANLPDFDAYDFGEEE